MTTHRHGSASVEFPNELDVVLTRAFDAPRELVFDVMTQAQHVVHHFAPFDEEMTVCEIDLRVGGSYHYVMVTKDGRECSFRGTFLEVERPSRSVSTWIFEGWEGVEAIETMDLTETDGVTTLTHTMSFPDLEGRAHMNTTDGLEASFDNVDRYLESLLAAEGSTSA
jgi:uncharacterized protein YndB with AHSA1/START domain